MNPEVERRLIQYVPTYSMMQSNPLSYIHPPRVDVCCPIQIFWDDTEHISFLNNHTSFALSKSMLGKYRLVSKKILGEESMKGTHHLSPSGVDHEHCEKQILFLEIHTEGFQGEMLRWESQYDMEKGKNKTSLTKLWLLIESQCDELRRVRSFFCKNVKIYTIKIFRTI